MGAAAVSLVVLDEDDEQFEIEEGEPFEPLTYEAIRTQRALGRTVRSAVPGEPDSTDYAQAEIFEHQGRTAVCFWLGLPQHGFGCLWVYYDGIRKFLDHEEQELQALRLYANQAVIAYRSAHRIKQLQQLNAAAETVSSAFTVKDVLRTIVTTAQEMFQAHCCTVWSYDHDLRKFIPAELDAAGIDPADLQVFREEEPHKNGVTQTVLRSGWTSVTKMSEPPPFLSEEMREHLTRLGIRSFSGVRLQVGEEAVGVLYVSHSEEHLVGTGERSRIESFAAHAALALKKVRLMDQLNRERKAAEAAARMTALGDRDATLHAVAQGTLDAVGCDAVTLYGFNPSTQNLTYPPTMFGVQFPEKARQENAPPPGSIIYKILQRDRPYIADNVRTDDLFRDRRFARDEGIQSCVALPLQAAGQKVGVMFVNFRTPRQFRVEDLTSMELFANQAAVAIRNSQLYDERVAKVIEQEDLLAFSRKMLATLDRQEILNRTMEVVLKLLKLDMCNTVLPDKNGDLRIVAALGWRPDTIQNVILAKERGSQTGFTIMTERPAVVDNFDEETRFETPAIRRENGAVSGLSVPIIHEGEVIGAMLGQTKTPRHFTDAEVNLLSLIANHVANALQRTRNLRRAHANQEFGSWEHGTGLDGHGAEHLGSCPAG
jgi:GAF domain-containing protein